jgi:phage repressor protein C with HTH and peptisase S24 domain
MALGDRIAAARKHAGLTQGALARVLKVGQSTVAQWETGKNEPPLERIRDVARACGTALSALIDDDDGGASHAAVEGAASEIPPQGSSQAIISTLRRVTGAPSFAGPRDLKILGHVKGGSEGWFIDNGEVQGLTVRPEVLIGVKDAYAVYVRDLSMAPAFEPNFLVWVDPSRPVMPGNDVVIQLTDGQAFIKRLVRCTQRAVICRQWNPARDVDFPAAKVKAVHLVVGQLRVQT